MKITTSFFLKLTFVSLLIESCSTIHRLMKKTIYFDKSTKYLEINQLNFDRIFSKYMINLLSISRNLTSY